MKIRINERDLKKMVAESTKKILNEINGYNQTMQNAGNKFNQNTFMGRVRSKINPQKYQQYQRIQQNAGQMGANATDTLNTAYDNMGDATVNFDYTAPDYTNYYMQKNPNAQTPHFANGYDAQGEQQFKKDYSTELGWQKKYGTGGRIAKPLYGNDSTIDKERIPYNQQRQAIKNGSIQEDTDLAQVWGDENYDDMNTANGVDSSKRRFIEDPSKFAQDLGQQKVAKYNRINARPAQGREKLVTYKQDPSIAGTGEDNIETTNDFEGGMVVNNVNTPWQKYGIDQKTFDKKYEIDPENPSQYRPKGGPMYASKVHDNVAFPNPWGQGHMNVDKGGYMMQDPKNKRDTYGIQDTDFNGTYREINENKIRKIVSESIKKVLGKKR